MKRVLTISIAILVLAVSFSWSQESESAERIFKWFPQGTYLNMSHRNIPALTQGKAYPLFEQYVGADFNSLIIGGDKDKKKKSKKGVSKRASNRIALGIHETGFLFGINTKLPKQFEEGLISSTHARLSVFETITSMEELEEKQKSGNNNQHTMIMMAEATSDENGEGKISHTHIMVDNGAGMNVHRFQDLQSNIKAALKAGTIKRVGKRIKGRPVYTFTNQEKGNRSNDMYVWATEDNELLVCDDEKYLKEMIKAGYGDEMRLLDDEDYVDLIQIYPDLGGQWDLQASGKTRKQFEKEMDKSKLSSEEIAQRKERNEKTEILSINSWKVTDKLIRQKYNIFHTTEAAEAALNKDGNGGLAGSFLDLQNIPESKEYQNMLKERTSKQVDGNVFSSTITYDERLFKAKDRANEALAAAIMKNNGHIKLKSKNGETMEFHINTAKEGGKVTVEGKKTVTIKK